MRGAPQGGLPKLSKLEAQALRAWEGSENRPLDEGYCLPFRAVQGRSGIPRHLVRRVVRALARKGVTEFHKGLWTEDGEMAGAGYGLTEIGQQIIRAGTTRTGEEIAS